MTVPAWPDHLLTLSDWEQLPEYESHTVEVEEGVLRVSPRPVIRHQRAIYQLIRQLNDQLPKHLNAVGEVELLVEERPLTIRIPDVMVVGTELGDQDRARAGAADVRLVVEVLSPGSRREDRITKFAEYAEAGIAQYWIADLEEPLSLATFTLAGNYYQPSGEFTGRVDAEIAGSPVAFDLAALTQR